VLITKSLAYSKIFVITIKRIVEATYVRNRTLLNLKTNNLNSRRSWFSLVEVEVMLIKRRDPRPVILIVNR
jgi:hypothetical protein